jgi:gamma-glutamylcyclotransferase (GGCT)/AIG2-like uncharacterized protein YtfP
MPEPVTPSPQRHVFVYGTLRRGDDNDITRLAPPPHFVSEAKIAGVMYHLGAYPGVVLAKPTNNASDTIDSGTVVGEVYAIEPELELVLDEIEALYPQQKDEYFKRSIDVTVGRARFNCIVYEINPAYVAGKPIITSGDWVRGRRA